MGGTPTDRSWLGALLECAPIGMCLARNGIILDSNPAYLRIFGFENGADVYGTSSHDRIAPESKAVVEYLTERLRAGARAIPEVEFLGLRRDGSRVPLLVQVQSVTLPDGPATVAFLV